LQRETIQLMLDSGYSDGYRLLHSEDKGYTFPTWDRRVRLDYIFLPGPHSERLKSCEVVTEPAELIRSASDHCPLLAELQLT
jgi:exonuclease III